MRQVLVFYNSTGLSISYSSISAADNQRTVAEFIDPWLGDKVNSGIGLSYRPSSHDFISWLYPPVRDLWIRLLYCGMTCFCLGGPSWGQILSPWLGLKNFQNWKEQAKTLSLIFSLTKQQKLSAHVQEGDIYHYYKPSEKVLTSWHNPFKKRR
jgi:hypothetical protein